MVLATATVPHRLRLRRPRGSELIDQSAGFFGAWPVFFAGRQCSVGRLRLIRETGGEGGAVAGLAFGAQGAAMGLDDGFRYRKP